MTQVKLDMSGFKTIEKALSDNYKVRVGILGSSASSNHKNSNLTNAEIGAKHEFGSVSENIPRRSFLKYPLDLKMGEWISKNKSLYYRLLTEGSTRKFYVAMGFAAENIIDEAFNSSGFGTWAANSPRTIALKGSAMPLIDTGQLKNSITSKVMTND
jgi:hypothetical protein